MISLVRACYAGAVLRLEAMRREEGQGLVEYALILVLVSVVCIAVLAALGVKISAVFQQVTDTL